MTMTAKPMAACPEKGNETRQERNYGMTGIGNGAKAKGGLALASLVCAAAVRAASLDVAAGETKTLDDAAIAGYDAISVASGGLLVLDTTAAPSVPITGEGVVRKSNSATWTMAAANADFVGTWEFVGGIVQTNPQIPNPFGKTDSSGGYRVVVTNGATLSVGDSAAAYGNMKFLIGGTGVDGRGALEFTEKVSHTSGGMIRYLTLADDATLTMKGLLILAYGLIDLDGRQLTLTGGGSFQLMGMRISERGEWRVVGEPGKQTTLLFRSWNSTNPEGKVTDADEMSFVLDGYATLGFYNRYQPFRRPLQVRGARNVLSHDEQFAIAADPTHEHQAWPGPITFLDGGDVLSSLTVSVPKATCGFALSGRISGPGALAFSGAGRVFIDDSSNDYTGGTTFGSGSYVLGARTAIPGFLPEGAPLDIVWTKGHLVLSGGDSYRVRCLNVQAAAADDFATAVTLDGVDVTVSKDGFWGVGVGGQGSRLVVTNALVRSEDLSQADTFNAGHPDYASMTNSLVVGRGARGVLEIEAGAVISNRLQVGQHGNAIWDAVSFGAVRQRGGQMVAVDPNGSFTKGNVLGGGQSCGGYYELVDGAFVSHGYFSVGSSGVGALWMRGGSFTVTNVLDTSRLGNFELGSFNGGHGSFRVSGGAFRHCGAEDVFVGRGWTSSAVQVLTVDGASGDCDFGNARVNFGYGNYGGSTFCVNLNGGVLTAAEFYKHTNANRHLENGLYVNFDGGTFRVGGSDGKSLFGTGTVGADRVTVAAGGATIDTCGRLAYVYQPILAPTGKGLASIRLPAPIKQTALPAVKITSSTGVGASAFAHYDWETRTIDRIDVLSAGVGYEDATVSLYFGMGKEQTQTIDASNVTLAENAPGGSFTKAGLGTLVLCAANAWNGATHVAGGTLKAECDGAIPAGTDVVLSGGGILDLGDTVQKIASVTYRVGGGQVINAGHAEMPDTAALEISVDDILAGKALALAGDVDLSKMTLTITGAFPEEMPESKRYAFVTTTGRLSGRPTIHAPDLPKDWWISVGASRLTLRPMKGGLLILR